MDHTEFGGRTGDYNQRGGRCMFTVVREPILSQSLNILNLFLFFIAQNVLNNTCLIPAIDRHLYISWDFLSHKESRGIYDPQ